MIDMSKVGDWDLGEKKRFVKGSAAQATGLSTPSLGAVAGSTTGGTSSPSASTGSGALNYINPADISGSQLTGTTAATESTGYGLNNSGFLFPDEWSQVGDYWSKILGGGDNKLDGGLVGGGVVPNQGGTGYGGGGKIQTPSSWTTGMEALTPMAQTGQPVSSDEWWSATQGVTNREIEDAIKNAAEQAGLGGMRWSTPLGYTAQDISGKYMGEATQQWADREMAAQEAAKQRQLEATNQLYQYGQGQYQMDKDALARRQAAANAAASAARYAEAQRTAQMNNAASALMGLGGQKAGLGLDVTNAMYNMGTGMQSSQQNAINSSYNNPYMTYANQYLASQPSGQQQTYQPSTASNVLGAVTSAAPWIASAIGGTSNNTGNYVGSQTQQYNPYNMSSGWTY